MPTGVTSIEEITDLYREAFSLLSAGSARAARRKAMEALGLFSALPDSSQSGTSYSFDRRAMKDALDAIVEETEKEERETAGANGIQRTNIVYTGPGR